MGWIESESNIEAIVSDLFIRARVLNIIIRLETPGFLYVWCYTECWSEYEDDINLKALDEFNTFYKKIPETKWNKTDLSHLFK